MGAALSDRLLAHLDGRPDLLPRGAHILVALSGGPDSTALVHLLARLAPRRDWTIVAAHFDHRLRPGGADRANEVRERLLPLGVQLLAGRAPSPPGRSHAELRRLRYAWLRSAARRIGADRIATAHQRDDQVETILFRLLRGTGSRGLGGIPVRRGPIVRPILHLSRHDLTAWLDAEGIPALDDPANRDPRYARTRMRHRLLPAMRVALDPGVDEDILALGRRARAVDEALEPVIRRAVDAFADGTWADWPAELRAEVLRREARRQGVRLRASSARTAAVAMPEVASGHRLDVGGGLYLERSFDAWTLRGHDPPVSPDQPAEIRGPDPGEARARLAGRPVRVRWGPPRVPTPEAESVALALSADHYPLTIRAWADGDRIRLQGGTRKLRRLFADARIPVRDRRSLPVLADRSGRVLCVLAPGLADRIDRSVEGQPNLLIEVVHG